MAGLSASIPEPCSFKSLREGQCAVVSGGPGKAIVRRLYVRDFERFGYEF